MKILIPVISAILSGVLVFFVMQKRYSSSVEHQRVIELKNAALCVQKQLNEISDQIKERLASFTEGIGADRDFSIKLLVENDRSAPVIAESAIRYRGAMGFSLLELTDSTGLILSSGHFPASAGSNAGDKLSLLSDKPVMMEDNVMGMQVLAWQAKKAFKIAEIPFYAMGGLTVDDELLQTLSPRDKISVLLKRGDDIMGMQDVRSISEVKNNEIIINDKKYPAVEIELPYKGDGEMPKLIVVAM